jgi:hypothetical protein
MDSLRPGDPQQIGDYILHGRLGAGGMGEVFFGRSPGGRPVAVKLINSLFAGDDEFRRRFRLEVEAGRKVGGFHTAQVVDADPDADRPWMVTAYVAGPSLKQVLAEHRALPLDSVRVLGAGLAEALAAIHAVGLIHRDLKPSNILLTYDGPRVIDFGVARAVDASAHTTQPGTPGFMAPEALTGKPTTWACDVFALGVVLAVAAGIHPFGEGPEHAITYRIVHEQPHLSGLDPQLRELVAECLVKEPNDRPKPERILERLSDHGSVTRWLPGPVLDMIPGYAAPEPTEVVRPGLQRDSRLLKAEQAARRVLDAYARAEAQVYVAAVVSRSDTAHAVRLLDDALRPTTQRDGTSTLSRQQMLRHLAGHATFELGTVLARSSGPSVDRTLDEIEGIIRSMIREEPGTVANVVIRLAEALASTDPDRADRIARMHPDQGVQASAVARAAMLVAHTDPARAERMARAIAQLTGQVIRPVAEPTRSARVRWWPRPREASRQVPTAVVPLHQDSIRLWAARALAEVAVAMIGIAPLQLRRPPTATEDESTITAAGDSGVPASVPTKATSSSVDPDHADRLLAEAAQLAERIMADDTRALALTAVTTAAAQVDPGRAGSLLTEAEQFARASSGSARDQALGEVALAAVRTEPARAEQIVRSLLDREQTVADVASAVAATDRACAERIAAAISDEYVHALVTAVIAVSTDPAHAEPQLGEALQAAHRDPAHMVEVAMVAARASLTRAEQIVHTIKSRDNIRTADFWKARALADLASLSDEMSRSPNDP